MFVLVIGNLLYFFSRMSKTFFLCVGLFAVLFTSGEGMKSAMEQILDANMNPGG